MISKKEFIELYCDEFAWKFAGVMAIHDQKVFRRLDINEAKTKQDLKDYGYPPIDVERHRDGGMVVQWNIDDSHVEDYFHEPVLDILNPIPGYEDDSLL